MIRRPLIVLGVLPVFTFLLSQCLVVDEGGNLVAPPGGGAAGAAQQGFSQPLTVVRGSGMVTILEGARVLSAPRTAMPNVEETRWYSEQEQVAVKSRGAHGPATIQLFDSRTGAERGRVMAYDVRSGQPAWATGMGE